jgi:hypothetical protein
MNSTAFSRKSSDAFFKLPKREKPGLIHLPLDKFVARHVSGQILISMVLSTRILSDPIDISSENFLSVLSGLPDMGFMEIR